MLISKDDLGEVFDNIHNVWIQTRTTVIILCAADCDSICTTKILTSLLATEMIAYELYPVLSYECIVKYNDHYLQDKIRENELHTIIMINCGGIVDLNQMLFVRPLIQSFYSEKEKQQNSRRNNNNSNKRRRGSMSDDDEDDFDIDEDELDGDQENEQAQMAAYIETNMPETDNNFKIYVIDCHRPFNLFNVHDQEKICLLQGHDEIDLGSIPALIGSDDEDEEEENNNNEQEQELNLEDSDDDFNIDDDDDDDLKDADDQNQPLKKRRRLNDGSDGNGNRGNNNNNSSGISDKQRQIIRQRRLQDEYYKFQEYALNSSGIMYLMARLVQKDDNDMLWSAILGLTESFIYEKITRDRYNQGITYYCDEVKRRNETYNNISTMDTEVRYNLAEENVENSSIVSHRNSDHIQFSTEFRFTLMRFWTLYDSMYYSRYVATKLGVWKQRGKDNLKYMLAKMALPLSEAQQPYSSMKREYKKKLPQLFEEHQNQGLDDNYNYGSFTKQHGGHQSISASDMVYAITAVLESDYKVKAYDNEHEINTNSNKNNNDSESKQNQNEDNLALFFDDNAWKSNFFYGYDVLSKDKQHLLRNAIKLAKDRQQEIVDQGIRLIEKKAIKPIGCMRYCKIENSNNFQSPMLLCKLALFIMDAYRAQTTKNPKHFVLASYNDKSNSYTVVGIPSKKYIGDVNKSPFYNAFEEARKRVNANAKIVFFEGHVIQIHKDHFTEWLENLHERLLSCAF